MATKKTYEDPGFKTEDVVANLEALKYTVNKILTAPPPKQEAPKSE